MPKIPRKSIFNKGGDLIFNMKDIGEEDSDEDYNDDYNEEEEEKSYFKKRKEKKRQKIEKFEEFSKPKAYKNVLKVTTVCLFFATLSLIDFMVNKNTTDNVKWMLENQNSIIMLEGSVSYGYAAIYESMASKQPNYEIGGNLIKFKLKVN